MKKKILIILIIILVLILAFSAWKLISIVSEYMKGEQVYATMEEYVSIPEANPQPEPIEKETEPEEAVPEETEPEAPPFPEVDFGALWAQNTDVVGWIYIPDTKINYPVLQGETNDTYLRHLINGKYNTAGSIFLEAGIPMDFSSQNNPIYGHRMRNGTMFADIAKYRTQKYYEAHPVGYLVTPDCNYVLHIFSGYVTSAFGDAWDTSFSEQGFDQWLKSVDKKSCFTSPVTPTTEDRILTFSTCTYEQEDARFVVHAVMEAYVPEQENTAE